MSIERIVTPIALGLISVLALTTIFGRKNAPAVFNSIGNAADSVIRATLGTSKVSSSGGTTIAYGGVS